jgi:hypothetical protein
MLAHGGLIEHQDDDFARIADAGRRALQSHAEAAMQDGFQWLKSSDSPDGTS